MDINEQKYEVIESIKDYLNRLIPGTEMTINHLRLGDEMEAMQNLASIFEGLEWLIEANTLTLDVIQESLDVSAINVLMPELSEAMNNSDYVLLADLFEYEIIPRLKEWSDKLNAIKYNQ